MFDRNRSDACCEGWGRGSNMLVSAEVESEKKRNSLMERFPSIVSATSLEGCVRTDLANRPTEPMLVSLRARYTKLCGNRGFLQSGSRQTTPVRVGVTCGSGISAVRVGRE